MHRLSSLCKNRVNSKSYEDYFLSAVISALLLYQVLIAILYVMVFMFKFLSGFHKTLWSLWKLKYITSFTFINYISNSVNKICWVNLYMSCFGWNHGVLLSSHNSQITRITAFYLFILFALLKDWHTIFFPLFWNFPSTYLRSALKIQKSLFPAVTGRPHS